MKFSARSLLAPLVAIAVLAFVYQQTISSLHRAGLWNNTRKTLARAADPYSRLDRALALAGNEPTLIEGRNPFGYNASATVVAARPTRPRVVPPPKVELPLVTAIVYDSDPRALIRYAGHDYTVRVGGLFEDYRVTSITRDQVAVEKNGQSLVLSRHTKGE